MNSLEVKILFESQIRKKYKKIGDFLYRFPSQNETVLTIVNGKLETLRTAIVGESVIIRNISIGSSTETYVIELENFINRYDLIDRALIIDGIEWKYCKAKSWIEAFCYCGETIEFVAPWGEKMLCESGDFLARPLNGKPDDIYRIERQTFLQTYTEEVDKY